MSIRNVFSDICSFETLLQAERNVRKGRRYGKAELSFWANLEDNIYRISEAISNLRFPPDRYYSFYVYEPKIGVHHRLVTGDPVCPGAVGLELLVVGPHGQGVHQLAVCPGAPHPAE